jgi:hypothetical protein
MLLFFLSCIFSYFLFLSSLSFVSILFLFFLRFGAHVRSLIVSFSSQIRGSIPLLWSQIQPWKLKPPILYTNNEIKENLQVLKSHLVQLCSRYFKASSSSSLSSSTSPSNEATSVIPPNSVYLVNLIDKKGSQGRLGSKWLFLLNSWFETVGKKATALTVKPEFHLSSLSDNDSDSSSSPQREEITYQSFLLPSSVNLSSSWSSSSSSDSPCSLSMIWFDYHYHMRMKSSVSSSLSELFTLLKTAFLLNHGFFTILNPSASREKERVIVSKQTNLLRTNCMDCLDRTNVIQSYLSRWMLFQQVVSLGGKALHFSSNSLTLPDHVRFFSSHIHYLLLLLLLCFTLVVRNQKQDFVIFGQRMAII